MSTVHNRRITAQVFSGLRQYLRGLSLQSRFLLTMGASSLFFALLSWTVFNSFTEQLIERIGSRFAETQMLYDKARTLQPLIHEIALAHQFANDPLLWEWAANEGNPKLRQRALAQMEKTRSHFLGGDYFVAIVKSENYYYNNLEDNYKGRQLRYALDPTTPDDAWFFDFISSGDDQRVRVASNNKLGVDKIWVMVPIRNGSKVVGVLGTGIGLDDFIRSPSNIHLPGVTKIFINQDEATQIYSDVDHIDFPGASNLPDHQHSTEQILSTKSRNQWVGQAIKKLESNNQIVETGFVQINGKRFLAGLSALPEVGWYDLTLFDLSILLPQADYIRMVLIIVLSTLVVLSILAFSLHKLVLKPVGTLTEAVSRIRQGDYSSAPLKGSTGEVRELASQFHEMAVAIHNTQNWLEDEIEKRTQQLNDAQQILEISLQRERDGRETQANLMALMAHEMRSPIAVISNTTQMLNMLAQSDHPELLPRLEKIMRSIRQLAALMDNFLTEKWLDMDKRGLNRVTGDLNQLCADIAINFSDTHAQQIRFQPWKGNTKLSVDWQLIRIAILNLLDNARKYSSKDDEIHLQVLPCKTDMICIEVRDHGVGIPSELQSRIFEKFARGRHGVDIQGSGIGLYLVNWIARFHGGYTEVSSIEKQGSAFRLYLPMYETAFELPASSLRSAPDLQL